MINHQTDGGATLWNDHMVDIHHVHEKDEAAQANHEVGFLFHIRAKQDEERNREVHEDQSETDKVPVFGVTKEEVSGLLGNVGIPDQEELGE